MQVLKSSGEFERFNGKKIYLSIRSVGGSKNLANSAVKEVKKLYREKIPTKEILEFLLKFLKKEPGISQRYNLKRAIMSLGPSGFPFEKFFARVLEDYGYKTTVDNKLRGKKIIQEVDIVAVKEKKWMVECKYHNEPGTITKLHPALYTYARFLDLNRYHFFTSWLVTNTRCSQDAIEYSKGVGQKITSWKYPEKESLQNLILKKSLFPITILESISEENLNKIYNLKIVVAKDLFNFTPDALSKKTHINKKVISKIIKEAKEVCSY